MYQAEVPHGTPCEACTAANRRYQAERRLLRATTPPSGRERPTPSARPVDEQRRWNRSWLENVLGSSRVTPQDIVDLDLGVSAAIIAADRAIGVEQVRSTYRRVLKALNES